ncbi:MAG: NAD(P)-dependent glycerol-3-phosphate dehydrogenase [Planctomycetota bacterium]|nr:NAD(P)-dependent glycerol-3-phosphate dehydrogenase [Planctomycetota bacterium]
MKITILGGGAMATACSVLLAEQPEHSVSIWARNPDYAAQMQQHRENKRLLPGITLPTAVTITSEIAAAVADTDMIVVSVPTAFLRDALTAHRDSLTVPVPIVSVLKGIENETLLRPSEIITEVLGNDRVVVLAGPSHAEEIARRLPASVVAASTDHALAVQVQNVFSTDRFRVYTNEDVIGVELGGALKNVLAIAVGICDGLGYGDNAKSALMTRGLVEMTRFGAAFGAAPDTLFGLAGIGDLITTCVSGFSRNRHVGERLGQGETLDQILGSMSAVAEGVRTTRSVQQLAGKFNIDMPITREVFEVLFENKIPEAATNALMCRPPKVE